MRSTFFVLFSVLLHCFAVAALVMSPSDRIQDSSAPARNEAVAVVVEKTAAPVATATRPVMHPKAVRKAPVHMVHAQRKIHKVKIATVLPTKKVVQDDSQSQDELDPAVSADDTQAVAVITKETKESDNPDQEPQFIPVKETPPPGVEAASDDSSGDQAQTEAASQDVNDTQDPAPVAIDNTLKASGNGTRSYLDLKQMPGNLPPRYPLEARLEHQEGTVELLYRVTDDGQVTDLKVVKSSGYRDLDQAAVNAISKYRFVPGQEGWARHPVAFALKGPAKTLPSRLRTFGAQTDASAYN